MSARSGLIAGFVALLLLAALLLWQAGAAQREHGRILSAGVAGEGEVLARRLDPRGDWWLAYAFRLPDGTMMRGEGPATRAVDSNADPYRQGAALTVRYLPADPARNLPETAPEPRWDRSLRNLSITAGVVALSLVGLIFGTAATRPRAPVAVTGRPAPPRGLSPGAVFGSQFLWIALALGLVVAGLSWFSQAGQRADQALWQAAIAQQTAEGPGRVTARMADSQVTRDRTTAQTTRNVRYFVTYGFTGPDGQPRTGQSRVFWPEYESLPPGSPVRVRVLRDDFDTNALVLAAPVLVNWRLDSLIFTLAIGAVLAAVGGGGTFWWKLRAARSGIVRDVTVVAHSTVSLGRRSFAWEDAEGKRHWSERLPPRHLPPVGATVMMRIDPKNGNAWLDGAM